jgi:hypothetical protein
VIDIDFSESEEATPIVYMLGLISIDWNMTEQFMTTLIWNYVGGFEVGRTVTNNLGNRSKAEMLLELSKKLEKRKEISTRNEFCAKAFNILRDNRNMLMHSHSVYQEEDGNVIWRRQNPKAPLGSVGCVANIEDLVRIRDEICILGKFIVALYLRAGKKRGKRAILPPLPEIFHLPARLKQLPDEPPPKKGDA